MLKKPNPSPLQTINDFLHQNSPVPLHLSFASLEIGNHQNGQLLQQVHRPQGHVILQKTPQEGVAQITVLDYMVFPFSFQFAMPHAQGPHEGQMLQLPRPLHQGSWYVDHDKLQLSFFIDPPDPFLRLQVTHVYQGILVRNQCCAPCCG